LLRPRRRRNRLNEMIGARRARLTPFQDHHLRWGCEYEPKNPPSKCCVPISAGVLNCCCGTWRKKGSSPELCGYGMGMQ
jgi:hypothetical protein